MTLILNIIIVLTALMAIYWVFYGQRKHNEMLNPKRKTELKAILFDMDGVIINSFDAWFTIFNQLKKKYGMKELTKEDFTRKVWGGSVEVDAKIHFKNKDVKEIADQYRELLMKYSDQLIFSLFYFYYQHCQKRISI